MTTRVMLFAAAAMLVAIEGRLVYAQTIMGAGTVSCGEWLRVRAIQSPNTRDLASQYQMQAWIDGYLSGTNIANPKGPDILISTPSGVAMYSWIDNYCRSNSLNALVGAASALAKELMSRAVR